MIRIELESPARVDGAAAAPQSLWLLVKLWRAATRAQSGTASWVRASELLERLCATRTARMAVSRAFADFGRWGVDVGWGTDPQRPPALLPLSGRSRGPFWLAPDQAANIEVHLRGRHASADEIDAWLQVANAPRSAEPAEPTLVPASAAYWQAWADAKSKLLEGRLLSAGNDGALALYRRAQSLAPDPYLRAMALLQQAIVWRRAGDPQAARRVLAELDRHWRDVNAPEQAWLGAMAAIVSAWCAYAERDLLAAKAILYSASVDPRWSRLFSHHPRVGCEHANLRALIDRGQALDASASQIERESAARSAVAHYQRALALGNEAEMFDSAASAASNLGWSLWLFSRSRLSLTPSNADPASAVPPKSSIGAATVPLQWIALALWLAQRYRVGGSSWNCIYLLRMVREAGPVESHPELGAFRRWPVLSVERFAQIASPITLPELPTSWLQLASAELANVDSGNTQVDALQRANLLLEVTWYEAWEGDLSRSAQAANRLRRRLRELNPTDRPFFRDALRRLPD